tara:strand:+ start:104 stop:1462 length:1359 start_codon:yes stop_codon:yes gene_type:complete
MNKVMGFIKGNLIVVISVVLILAFLPTGYIFSQKWNKQVQADAEAAYKKEKRTLDSKSSINYSLPAVLDGEADLSESRAPNTVVTEFYKARKAEREVQVADVVERGTEFNRGNHVQLVEGILPAASDNRTLVRLAREMAEAIVGTESRPSVYQRKLQRLNAGLPPRPEVLAATLGEFETRERQRYQNSNTSGQMTPEQAQKLTNDLTARRLGEYIGQSKSLTFYCSTNAFVSPGASGSDGDEFSHVPSQVPAISSISEPVVFNWLWDYWVITDVLDAAARANTSVQTGAMSIPDAPVKSVESIRVSKLDLTGSQNAVENQGGGRRGAINPAGSRDDGEKPTFTGRKGGEAQSAFDIRMIQVQVVASSKDLPKFIDAIGKTNYMTVTDIDLDSVDVWGDLESGFYYGDEHVVRATMTIESVWLRSWMAPMMPDTVKTALGVPMQASLSEDFDG